MDQLAVVLYNFIHKRLEKKSGSTSCSVPRNCVVHMRIRVCMSTCQQLQQHKINSATTQRTSSIQPKTAIAIESKQSTNTEQVPGFKPSATLYYWYKHKLLLKSKCLHTQKMRVIINHKPATRLWARKESEWYRMATPKITPKRHVQQLLNKNKRVLWRESGGPEESV